MFALVDSWIDQQEFAEYWQSLTGDSYIVDVRRAKKKRVQAMREQPQRSVSTL